METKYCSKCKKSKSLKEFYNFKGSPDGLTYYCKACYKLYRDSHREYQRLFMKNLRDIDNEYVKLIKRLSYKNIDPRKKLFSQARNRARRKNIEFTLKISDIIIPENCPLLECPFIVGERYNYEYTHSLDRKNPNRGYTKDNVWVITKKANSMKNSASKEELVTFANNILKYFKDDDIVRTSEKSLELENKESLG